MFRGGKANDATAVGIYTTVTSLLPLSIQPARPSLSTFQVSLVICHNIVADDRTGDFLFLSHSLGVLISQNNANIELPGLVFSLYTTIKDQSAFVFTTWTALVIFSDPFKIS